MQQPILYAVLVLLSGGLGAAGIYFFGKRNPKSNTQEVKEEEAKEVIVPSPAPTVATVDVSDHEIVKEARASAKELVLEARDAALKIKSEAEEKARKASEEVVQKEKDISIQRARMETQEKEIESKVRTLKQAKDAIDTKQEQIEEMYRKQKSQLEEVASLTKEEARKILLEKFEKELVEEKGRRVKEMEESIKKNSEEKSKEILLDAIRYGATEYIVEYTTSRVKLPDEELKGRIIGKAGRNIMSFENLTGVELDLDSTPGEILVSSFDPVRREIARLSLERLITDGRIQPGRIEDIVDKTQKEVDHMIFKEGDNLCHKLGVYNLDEEIVKTLGRFKYRFSYGQNMIKHTLEVARIGTAIAYELKADVETVKRGCLLHDIGKVLVDEEGSHVQIGVDFLRKHKVEDKVVACVEEHHEDKPFTSIESAIVGLADHISGARPSARSEDYESYVKRMTELEGAATSFDGVERAYAIAAGREVRVFVKPEVVDDASTALLAREIARKIELEQTYPGVVKVVVIRETKVSETAK